MKQEVQKRGQSSATGGDYNALFAGAQRAVRITPGPIAVLFAVVLVVGFGKLASFLYSAFHLEMAPPIVEDSVFYVAVFAPALALLFLWVHLYERRGLVSLLGSTVRPLSKAARGFLVGISIVAGTVLLLILSGAASLEGPSEGATGAAPFGGVLAAAVLIWAFPAAAEEILARGWLLQSLGIQRGPAVAVIVSALAFVLWHWLLDTSLGTLPLANLALAGVFWGLYALKEGSLLGVIVAHAAYNWAETNLFGFGLYGSEPAGGSLLDFEETGPEVLTGGGVGLNTTGGLAFSVVQLAAVATLMLFARKDRSSARALRE